MDAALSAARSGRRDGNAGEREIERSQDAVHKYCCAMCGQHTPCERRGRVLQICLSRQVVAALGVGRGRIVEVGTGGSHPSGLAARVRVAILTLFVVAAAPPCPAAALPAATLRAAALPAAALVCSHRNRLALEL